jgi:hypothetical protein
MSETTPAYTPAPAAKTNVLSIVSLVTSILGISLVGVITGHIGLSQIKKTGESGRGLALAGVIIGYIGLVIGLLWVVFVGLAIILSGGASVSTGY